MGHKIFGGCLFAGLLVLGLTGCYKDYEMDLPLAVNSRALELTKDAGSTHVLVYSTGDWSVKFAEPAEWASLDRLGGSGNSEFVLSYAANFGLARRVKIALEKGEHRDTIAIWQTGSIKTPSLVWPEERIFLCKDSGTVRFSLSSNLYYSLQNVTARISYPDDEGDDWLSNAVFDGKSVSIDVAENMSENTRHAEYVLSVLIPALEEESDAYGTYTLQIVQNAADGELVLSDPDILGGEAASVSVDATVNTVWPYKEDISYSVEYSPAVEDGDEWISNLSLTSDALTFDTSNNMSGAFRTANVNVLYKGEVIERKTFTQDAAPVAIDFGQLRGHAPGELTAKEIIEGYVISENGSENVCQNTQTAQYGFDHTENQRTAIVESLDGKYGVMLKFNNADDNTLRRYSKVRIQLDGLTLEKQDSPECYVISNLTSGNILSAGEPNPYAVPVKSMSPAELSDSDIYTLVTLRDMEIVFKDGCYTNCAEAHSIKTGFNPAGTTSPRWDVAPLLLTDKSGNTMSMLTNALVEWRRDGTGVAQGSGDFRGVVVAETLVRYGDIGKYQIRPMVEDDIILSDAAFTKTLVEWSWNDAKNDVVPEIGSGSISGLSSTALITDYNAWIPNNVTTSRTEVVASGSGGKGLVTNQAAYFYNTWTVGSAFDVHFSTSGVSGGVLQFGFTWGHGKGNSTTLDAPSHWRLSYSIDGGSTFKEFVSMVKNRSVVWWTGTSQDSTPGYTEHLFTMPSECLNQESVIVRFEVADNVCDSNPGSSASTWQTDRGIEQSTFTSSSNPIRFGTLTVRYN